MPKIKTKGQVFGIIFITLIIIVLLVVTGFNVRQLILYNDFYRQADKAIPIPGLWDGVVPQGFEYDDETFYMSGYMENGGSSRIYAFDENGENVRYVELIRDNGRADDSHAGGFAIWNDFAFLATDGIVNIYLKSDFLAALEQNGGTLAPVHKMKTPIEPAFCYVSDDGYLYVGEFYEPEDYETDKTHKVTTDCGDNHQAFIAVYKLSEKAEYAVESNVPYALYSIRNNVQGMCITEDGNIALITSLGLTDSHAYIYIDPANGKYEPIKPYSVVSEPVTGRTFRFILDNKIYEIPVYCLDTYKLHTTWTMPPMAEEPVYKDGKIYVMYESASNKYLFGKLSGGTHVYSFEQK